MKRLVFALLPALSACVAPIGNGVLQSAATLPPGAALAVNPTQSQTAVETALTRLGYRIDSTSPYRLDAAFSERSLGVSIESEGSLHSASAKLPIVALCPERVQRLTVVVVDQRTARPLYQGEAELTQCAGTITDNATRLADAALAKMH
jgi:hypothetical protein